MANFVIDPQDTNKISPEGILKFLEDLQLPADSKLVLIIAWKFQAETQCEFSHDEFVNGMTELR